MKNRRMGGFTIIETILFLAGSSMLILVAMTAISGRNREIQFTDGMRGLQSYTQQHYLRAQNGVTSNDTAQGCNRGGSLSPGEGTFQKVAGNGDGSCVFLGYALEFATAAPDNSTIKTYQVYGTNYGIDIPTSGFCASPANIFQCVSADFTGDGSGDLGGYDAPQVFDIPWGLQFKGAYETRSGSEVATDTRGIGFLRNPEHGGVEPVVYNGGTALTAFHVSPTSEFYSQTRVPRVSDIGVNVGAALCFSSVDEAKWARLNFGTGNNNLAIELEFSDTARCKDLYG